MTHQALAADFGVMPPGPKSLRARPRERGLAWPYWVALFLLAAALVTFMVLAISKDDPPCPEGEREIGTWEGRWEQEHRACMPIEEGTDI